MKLLTQKVLLCGFCLFLSSISFAGTCGKDSCTATVHRLYVNDNGVINIQLNVSSSVTSTLDCSLAAGVYFQLNPANDSNAQAMYATLLAAAHSGREVELRAADNSTGCQILYITESFG